jgi:hypothetical protein
VTWQLAETFLEARLGAGAAADWLRAALGEVREDAATGAGGCDSGALVRRFAAAGRRLGRATIAVDERAAGGLEVRLAREGLPLPAGAWAADELGRAALLGAALEAGAPPTADDAGVVTRVEALYRGGELREQEAVARCLAHLPGPGRFVPLAVEMVRSNATALLEAIACRNPFPAAHVPDAAFNQMVVKCLFCGLPLAQIRGLDGRRSSELDRMIAAFASERRAAGRPVPADAASSP